MVGEWKWKLEQGKHVSAASNGMGRKQLEKIPTLLPLSLPSICLSTVTMTCSTRCIIQRLPCPYSRCNQTFRTQYGRTQHINTKHSTISSASSSHVPPPSPASDPFADRGDFEDFCAPSPADSDSNTQAANPAPQRNDNPEFEPRVGTKNYHPYLTGTYIWSVFIMYIVLTCTVQAGLATIMGYIYHLILRRHLLQYLRMFRHHSWTVSNSASQTFFSARWRCPRVILMS